MSEDEGEAAKSWDLLPAINLLRSGPASVAPAAAEEPPPTTALDDSTAEHPVTDSEEVAEPKPEGGNRDVPRCEEGVAVLSKEHVTEDALTVDENAVAVVERHRSLRALLLDSLDRHKRGKSNPFALELQRYDLDNGFRCPSDGIEPGVSLGVPKTTPATIYQSRHPPEHPRLISNDLAPSPLFYGSPALFLYEPLKHGPPGSWPMTITRVPLPRPKEIEPLEHRSATERKQQLVTKLVRAFPKEAKNLLHLPVVQNMQAGATTPVNAIHVFVDCSNILIGFFDSLKIARGMPVKARTRRVPFSFHSFALILERGRPVARRILVGSNPLVPAVFEAEKCGYETCILDRVMKARELPLRLRANGAATGNFATSSSSEAASGPKRMVEQAVDEVLHLKILESLVDAKKPSTIVLASGDAAEAEYSAGFMKMVERALEKGWKVELVSFVKNLSSAYRDQGFLQKWKNQFQVILLDSFAEELLDM